MRVRLRFSKSETLRFIGHLDFLRVFQQTIRRAELPAAFSQGFNPHLQISFALPLPLGMESVNDYADLTLEKEIPLNEITEKLNAAAPNGLTIKNAYPAENKAASVVCAADYSLQAASNKLEEVLQAREIFVAKKTKKGIRNTDIRPDILSIESCGDFILIRLSAGSARFLNPQTVSELLLDEKKTITRLELFQQNENGELVTL
ncbi:MAG: TIGR03936 family radical SAM-associated protein [Clostridiales bacterium]|nr:TIGR03936 family radical SAM-associated protein [Clostridiales bacterium]